MTTPYFPELCVWETTLACNLACRHCGSSAGTARPRELDTSEALRLIEALAAMGTCELTLSGGEVFLRPDWPEIFARARDLGIVTLVVSNGLSITRDVADRMAELGLAGVSLSIDGGAQLHDWLRPLNAKTAPHPVGAAEASPFERLGRAIGHLQAAGVPVSAITQVSKLNLPELPAVADLLVSRGVDAWQIQITNAMGRARRGDAASVPILDPHDVPELYGFVRRVQREGRIRCLAADCIGYFDVDEPLLRSSERPNDNFWQGCQAGLRVLGITSDGGVKGCLSLPDTYLEANLREAPLREIWARDGAFAYNRAFKVASLTGACRGCAFGKICRAGCHSFAATAQEGDISRYDHCIRTVAGRGTPTLP